MRLRAPSPLLGLLALVLACQPKSSDPKPPRGEPPLSFTLEPGEQACPPYPGPAPAAVEPGEWPLPSNQYVYLDHGSVSQSKCVRGKCESGQMISSTPPSDLMLTDSTKLVFTDGFYSSGPLSSGGGGWEFAVDELPYTREDVTIQTVRADGTVVLSFRGIPLELAPQASWRCGSISREPMEADSLVDVKTEVFFENLGVRDKSTWKPRH